MTALLLAGALVGNAVLAGAVLAIRHHIDEINADLAAIGRALTER